MKKIIMILFGFLVFTTQDVAAFRCGAEIASRGDAAAALDARCGPPSRKEFAEERIDGRWESVERWYYNCGERDFIYRFLIVAGTIKTEDTVGRGVGKSNCEGRK